MTIVGDPSAWKMPRLTIFPPGNAPSRSRQLAVSGEWLIGRDPRCDIAVSDEFASSRHLILRSRYGAVQIEDLGSTNGTFHNGVRLHGKSELSLGDRFRIGETDFLVELEKFSRATPRKPELAKEVPSNLRGSAEALIVLFLGCNRTFTHVKRKWINSQVATSTNVSVRTARGHIDALARYLYISSELKAEERAQAVAEVLAAK